MVDLNRANNTTEGVEDEVANLFKYHPWDTEQTMNGDIVRGSLQHSYIAIVRHVPPCPARTVALRKIVEARMDANAAITHGGKY